MPKDVRRYYRFLVEAAISSIQAGKYDPSGDMPSEELLFAWWRRAICAEMYAANPSWSLEQWYAWFDAQEDQKGLFENDVYDFALFRVTFCNGHRRNNGIMLN